MKNRIAKVVHFLNEEIWRIRPDDTSRRQFFLIRALRVLFLAIKGFVTDKCQEKGSALTFYSLLSVVPVAAMAFGIAKGFGFDKRLRALLESRVDASQEEVLGNIVDFAMNYLENTSGGQIAGIGLVILLWSVMKVFGNIETTFNDIWEVKHSRSFIRKFSDYITLMLVAILTLVSSSGMVLFVSDQVKGNSLADYASPFLAVMLPYLIIWIVFTLLLYIMPNARVKFGAALFGGVIAGTMFQLLQYGYIHFQVGVSKYNAIYGSFAALPLFLIWMQLSWLIVLFGAELSFAFQNARSFEFDADTQRISYRYKRLVCLLMVHHVIKVFEREETPPSNLDLSVSLKLPLRLVNELLFELVESKVFSEVSLDDSKETYYQPALDINKLTITKVIDMMESKGSSDFHFEETKDLNRLKNILSGFEFKLGASEDNLLLKDL
jgi:membrane protein